MLTIVWQVEKILYVLTLWLIIFGVFGISINPKWSAEDYLRSQEKMMYTSAMNVTKNNHCPLGVQSTTLMSESLKPKCGREQDSQPDPVDIKVFSLSSTGVIARERTTINLDCSRELYGVILSS